jgi:hypothetical protein
MPNKLAICTLMLVIWSTALFAQISAYHGIVYPYDTNSRLPQTISGVSIAIPDVMSGAQANPAGLAFINAAQLSLSMGQNLSHYDVDSGSKSESFSENQFYQGLFAGSAPLTLFKKRAVFSVTVNKIQAPEFEIYKALEDIGDQPIHHSRKGNVWNTTIGMGGKITDHLSFGLGLTKWFGHWSWRDEIGPGDISGAGTFKYTGISYTFSLLQQFSKVSLAVAVHSPFTLMKAEDVRINSWYGENVSTLEQYFKGAARIGIAYHLTPQLTLGAGYRYQGSIIVKDHVEGRFPESGDYNYSPSHQISLGGEYIFTFDNITLPVFVAYRTYSRMQDTQNNDFQDYEILTSKDDGQASQEIMMGVNLLAKTYGIYLTAQWNAEAIRAVYALAPPWS